MITTAPGQIEVLLYPDTTSVGDKH